MAKTPLHLYINHSDCPPGSVNYASVTEALEAAERLAPVPAKIAEALAKDRTYPAPVFDVTPVILHIGAGRYRERLVVSRPRVSFLGESREDTVIVYGLGALDKMENGENRGTFRTASVRIDAPDFTARSITFQNDAGFGHTVGQALALYVDADRCFFEDCAFLGSQDTLFTAPLPLKETKPGGFKGPGEFRPRIVGRHLYRNCLIRGDVDFIFGGAVAWFEDCEIFSQKPGDRKPPESPDDEVIYGYVTAASTLKGQPYGYVFYHCRLTSDCPPHTVYLGRPWREYAKTVFLHCHMGDHIHPLGWKDWDKPHGHFLYAEYGSTGPGAAPGMRADFSRQLTEAEASLYSRQNVLEGWDPSV